MSISPNNTTRLNITPTLQMSDDTNIERVSQFKYLGSILKSENSVDAKVESRINRAAQVFHSINRLVWYQNKISFNKNQTFQIHHHTNPSVWQRNMEPIDTSYTTSPSIRK